MVAVETSNTMGGRAVPHCVGRGRGPRSPRTFEHGYTRYAAGRSHTLTAEAVRDTDLADGSR